MTEKDYELLANGLHAGFGLAKTNHEPLSEFQKDCIVDEVAHYLAIENPQPMKETLERATTTCNKDSHAQFKRVDENSHRLTLKKLNNRFVNSC
jgi:hypothetical protein